MDPTIIVAIITGVTGLIAALARASAQRRRSSAIVKAASILGAATVGGIFLNSRNKRNRSR
ncbi:hypothetical protein GCM10009555_025530 [Acrocarpospora macrocephala]|uniref:Uncharacterized protein n=1 Tax=Acrocarpospora macrocephala TaxID=150177 RepID=A0A5M3WM15_9ACTN|nr:hypothetical protein [Acrocarpospora macrocephala]GES10317.1 hypothetical protein Amac_039140 [Acrocarpospora macrocephala]